MRTLRYSCLFVLLLSYCVLPTSLGAQAPADTTQTVGFAFAGGGAKGLAIVGALVALEEAGIYPDVITGTSIGSIVGGLYAMGYSAKELEKISQEIDWASYFDDGVSRNDVPVEERDRTDRYQLTFALEDGKISIPPGILGGQKIHLLLSRLTIPVHNLERFDEMQLPFACIATDCATGEAAVLSEGHLPDAMRASMAIPTFFDPAEIDGRLYVDGGVVRNLPVQDAKELGADIVVAFNIGAPLYDNEELTSFTRVLEQIGSYEGARSTATQLMLADYVITPDVNEFNVLSFEAVDTLLARGYRAGKAAVPDLLKIIPPKAAVVRAPIVVPDLFYLHEIEVKGQLSVQQRLAVNRIFGLRTGEAYTADQIEDRIEKLIGSQFVSKVTYRLLSVPEGYRLELYTVPQSEDFVRLSVNYDSDLKAGLLLNATLRNKLITGSQLSADIKVSENPKYRADYTFHTTGKPTFGVGLHSYGHFLPGELYDPENGELLEDFGIRHFEHRGEVFSGLNNRFLLAGSLGYESYARSIRTFSSDKPVLRTQHFFTDLTLRRDARDRVHFTRGGSFGSLQVRYGFGGKVVEIENGVRDSRANRSLQARGVLDKLFPIGRQWALFLKADAGGVANTTPNFFQRYYLGRRVPGEWQFVNFVGLDYMQRTATAYAIGRVQVRYEFRPDTFFSLHLNGGRYDRRPWNPFNENAARRRPEFSEGLAGIGGELGLLTRAGPVYFQTNYDLELEAVSFWLHLGYWF